MKPNIIRTLCLPALLLTSCMYEEPFITGTNDGRSISITVNDGGYASEGKTATRATENGYCTEFTPGDVCGLYIVRDGAIVYDNVKLTATACADDGLTWQSEVDMKLYGGQDGEIYFLYYPYQEKMVGKIDSSATDDAAFFAPLISTWQPEVDQSTYAAYTASDLMTATGTSVKTDGKHSISFAMTHRMALAVIETPKMVYKFTNNSDGAIPDFTTVATDFSNSDVQPFGIALNPYRYLVNPTNSTATRISGNYAAGSRYFSITLSDISAGNYKIYKIAGAHTTEKSYDLQPGDYFCKDSNGKWYIIPGVEKPCDECIGIVFYAGRHTYDNSDYSQSLSENGQTISDGTVHGYAIALQDAAKFYMWGPTGIVVGCYPMGVLGNGQTFPLNNKSWPGGDWSGYDWTRKIIAAANGLDHLNWYSKEGYPATYHAVIGYQNNVPAPANCSGWYLPSIGQMCEAYRRCGSITTAGGIDMGGYWYWTSSEYGGIPYAEAIVWQRNIGRDSIVLSSYKADNSGAVRAVLTF